ncbi:MAG: hypothetical protein BIFFINMI_00710 [Phycisphaerae bacterium]|nr:hypothetical protein [Phycisphaerae bacterium]
MRRNLICGLLALSISATAGAAEIALTAGPIVARSGQAATISFTVSGPTDVEVAILDGKGAVVRHLAAGVLGGSEPPPPPLAAGLVQQLPWDGKDDAGAAAGPDLSGFTVRVRLGIGGRCQRIIGQGDQVVGGILGLATDGDGNVYALNYSDYSIRSSPQIQVFDPHGRYFRTILPGPLAPEGAAGWLAADGRRFPQVFSAFQCFYPESALIGRQTPVVSGGRLLLVNGFGDIYARHKPRLLRLGLDGALPSDGFPGPMLQQDEMAACAVHLATSPGGSTIYATGLLGPGKWKRDPQNVVLSLAADGKSAAKVLVGEPYKAGNDATHLNGPAGLAVDSKGNLYVADKGNNRVAVFDPAGKFAATIDVPSPGPIAISPKSGAIFLISGADDKSRGGRLLCFASRDARPEWNAPIPANAAAVLAADPTADAPRCWLGLNRDDDGTGELILMPARTSVAGSDKPGLLRPMYIAADRSADLIYVRDWARQKVYRFDGAGGPEQPLPYSAADVAVDAGGRVYACTGGYRGDSVLTRYGRDGKPAPFDDGRAEIRWASTLRGGHMRGVRGLAVGDGGTIYVLRFAGYQDKDKGWDGVQVDTYAPDGRPLKSGLVALGAGAGCIRVDRSGNLYVAEHVMPAGSPLPAALARVDAQAARVYRDLYGSVLKFGPAGGAAVYYQKDPGPDVPGRPGVGSNWGSIGYWRLTGDLRGVFPGISPVGAGPRGLGCTCLTPRFELDGFGRLILPDAAQCSVRVLDGAGNLAARLGGYGNVDADGKDGSIPLAWPAYVACSDKALYICDIVNRRVVRVELTFAAEASCPVK